jgi:hypothetical protein
MIDNPQGEGGRLKGFLAGATEGAGDLVSDMTSPFSIGMSALGLGGIKKLMGLRGLKNATSSAPDLAMAAERLGPEFTPIGSEALENTFRTARMAAEKKRLADIARTSSDRRPDRKWSDFLMLEENRHNVSPAAR